MAIEFDSSLNREIKRAVDKFNKKVNRARKHGAKYLPPKQSIKLIKEEFSGITATRAELRKRLKSLENFNLKTATNYIELPSGERTSKFQFELAKRQQRRLRKEIAKEIEEQERFLQNEPRLIMRKSRLDMLKNIQASLLGDIKSRDVIRSIQAQYTREFSPSRLDNFYEELFEIMDSEIKTVGYNHGEFTEEQIKELKEKMMRLKPEVLLKMRQNDNLMSMILDKYNSDEQYTQQQTDDVIEVYKRLISEFDIRVQEFMD